MKEQLVLYYSKTGNSKFIAEKLSQELGCDLKRVTPKIDNVMLMVLLSTFGIGIPTNLSKKDLDNYDEVIILGPIWAGLLVSPLRSMINKCIEASKGVHFAVTCETKDEEKNSKFGYAKVLQDAKDLGGKFLRTAEAFSTSLVNIHNESWSPKLSEKIKITEGNFKGRVQDFAHRIKTFEENNISLQH